MCCKAHMLPSTGQATTGNETAAPWKFHWDNLLHAIRVNPWALLMKTSADKVPRPGYSAASDDEGCCPLTY